MKRREFFKALAGFSLGALAAPAVARGNSATLPKSAWLEIDDTPAAHFRRFEMRNGGPGRAIWDVDEDHVRRMLEEASDGLWPWKEGSK